MVSSEWLLSVLSLGTQYRFLPGSSLAQPEGWFKLRDADATQSRG